MFDFLRFNCQQILRTNDASDGRTMHATSNRQAERNQLIVFLRFYFYHHSVAAHMNHLSSEWRAGERTGHENNGEKRNETAISSARLSSAYNEWLAKWQSPTSRRRDILFLNLKIFAYQMHFANLSSSSIYSICCDCDIRGRWIFVCLIQYLSISHCIQITYTLSAAYCIYVPI